MTAEARRAESRLPGPIASEPMARRSADDDQRDEEALDDGADDVVDDVAVESPPAEPGQPGRARGPSEVPTKWAIDRLDDRERRFSFVAAGGAVLFGVIVYLAETENSACEKLRSCSSS